MKRQKLRAIALFLLISAVALSFASMSAANGSTPTLYKNDTKYSIEEYPAEIINGTLYVPVIFFIGLENIQYQYDSELEGFFMMNEKTGRFFSYSFSTSGIVVDKSFENIDFPISHSTVYLPLEYCAEILSLGIEKKADGKATRIRVTDGSQKLTFDDLIELYDPIKDPEGPPEIVPEGPKPIEQPSPTDRYIYITIDASPNEYTDSILDSLDNNKVKATFFFTEEGIKSHPDAVIRAYVEGHGIGIYADKASFDKIESANDALNSVLNFRTRLCRISGEIPRNFGSEAGEKGYLIWSSDLDSEAYRDLSATAAARNIYNKTFEKNVTVVRLISDDRCAGIIDRLLYYISGDKYITPHIISPTTDIQEER